MTMIERVAARLEKSFKDAVAASAGREFERTGVASPAQDVWLRYAKEAIAEMREPTEAMLHGLSEAVSDSEYAALRHEIPESEILRLFAAMIDAALGEKP